MIVNEKVLAEHRIEATEINEKAPLEIKSVTPRKPGEAYDVYYNPNAVDAEIAAKAFDLGEHERTQLCTLFERSDELRFSGSGNGAKTISNDEREEVLRLLERLRA